jgi:hypothetical protein
MAPVHNTDLADERWSQAEWEHYELWESVEVRLRRRMWLCIALTAVVFIALSSVPIIIDRAPKWTALSLSRHLSQQVTSLKRETAELKQSLRIRFEPGTLNYVVERAARCADSSSSSWTRVRQGSLASKTSHADGYALLSPEQGAALNLPGLAHSFCYDPLAGADTAQKSGQLSGFGIVPVKDLAESRSDRVSLLLLRGSSAEMSFE